MCNSNFPYTILIREQPILGRMCGLKDAVDRRVLHPPLIIELQDARSEVNEILLQPNSFVCHLSIFSVSKQECMSVVAYENSNDCVSYQKLLLGDEPAPGVLLKDPVTSKNGIFFGPIDYAVQ
ncbi:hypothetical protein BC833DRAFT_626137 [Globomyces pollinis-pini]|nr:hypothetical protein BC833DRAFT_626137 [Globomyces pollinis-pini]